MKYLGKLAALALLCMKNVMYCITKFVPCLTIFLPLLTEDGWLQQNDMPAMQYLFLLAVYDHFEHWQPLQPLQ